MSDRIFIPQGADIALLPMPPYSAVAIAPPGQKVTAALFGAPGNVSALFSHDRGLTWPNARNCRLAGGYLAESVPIAFMFRDLASALICRARLQREMAE